MKESSQKASGELAALDIAREPESGPELGSHDSHLSDDAGYFGCWCFELAAFVKELKIDVTAFAGNPFYPRDIVHSPSAKGG